MSIIRTIKDIYCSARTKIENLPKIPVDADQYSVLESPKIFQERLLSCIRNAHTRICICALYWQNDEMGQEVMQAVYEAKKKNPELSRVHGITGIFPGSCVAGSRFPAPTTTDIRPWWDVHRHACTGDRDLWGYHSSRYARDR